MKESSTHLCTCRRFTGSLQTDEHDDIGLALRRLEGRYSRIDELQQLIEDCPLDQTTLVYSADHLLEIYCVLHIGAQLADEAYVHVGLDQGCADLKICLPTEKKGKLTSLSIALSSSSLMMVA